MFRRLPHSPAGLLCRHPRPHLSSLGPLSYSNTNISSLLAPFSAPSLLLCSLRASLGYAPLSGTLLSPPHPAPAPAPARRVRPRTQHPRPLRDAPRPLLGLRTLHTPRSRWRLRPQQHTPAPPGTRPHPRSSPHMMQEARSARQVMSGCEVGSTREPVGLTAGLGTAPQRRTPEGMPLQR